MEGNGTRIPYELNIAPPRHSVKVFVSRGGRVQEYIGSTMGMNKEVRFPMAMVIRTRDGAEQTCTDFILNTSKEAALLKTGLRCRQGEVLTVDFSIVEEDFHLGVVEAVVETEVSGVPGCVMLRFMGRSQVLSRIEDLMEEKSHLLEIVA